MSSNLIEIKDLTWSYPESPYLIFNNFNLDIGQNDFFVLMGKSGTGKTTLSSMILGQYASPPNTIFYKGKDISTFTKDQIQSYRKKIGVIFQDYKLVEEMTVKENIIYPLKIYEIGQSVVDIKYSHIQDKLDLYKISDIPVKYLSSGEKQKVAIARALIHNPELIVADEPTGNLDREETQNIANMLISSHVSGNTVLLITHDIHLLNYLKEKYPIKLFILDRQ